ncbi:MAG: transcription factor S [Candidatus Thermoplasmatota archaeon]|nr:transcription factor S [Candidatus Thermoplasmatota archaeon]
MFCPECGALMKPSPDGPQCKKCGTTGEGQKITQKAEEKEITVLNEDEIHTLPRTDEFPCPECGGRDAYYRYQQTRAADEPTTIILQCVECKEKWRKY